MQEESKGRAKLLYDLLDAYLQLSGNSVSCLIVASIGVEGTIDDYRIQFQVTVPVTSISLVNNKITLYKHSSGSVPQFVNNTAGSLPYDRIELHLSLNSFNPETDRSNYFGSIIESGDLQPSEIFSVFELDIEDFTETRDPGLV